MLCKVTVGRTRSVRWSGLASIANGTTLPNSSWNSNDAASTVAGSIDSLNVNVGCTSGEMAVADIEGQADDTVGAAVSRLVRNERCVLLPIRLPERSATLLLTVRVNRRSPGRSARGSSVSEAPSTVRCAA